MWAVILVSALLSLFGLVCATSPSLAKRQDCGSNYAECSPPGASTTSIPDVGGNLSSMYIDLLDSTKGIEASKRNIQSRVERLGLRSSSVDVCCAEGTSCLLLHSYNVPFCYDKFTTNFFLPDGSYGTIDTGNYTAADGSIANLITGNYTLAAGPSGNMYSTDSSARPNTAALTLPTPYTSAGIGSAIPASELGNEITYTTTLPATTVQPSTVAEETMSPIVLSGSTVSTKIAFAETTVPGTTIPVRTAVITTRLAATSTGAANLVAVQPSTLERASLWGFLLLALGGV
ncbi:hypothetical protein MMC20_003104 [Loxospora ochrophaea]|nr:hypothetical protein [Loxospora ochrophaea]